MTLKYHGFSVSFYVRFSRYVYSVCIFAGTRESAFVFSLAAAVVSHSISRACSSGELPSCSCAPAPAEQAGPDFRWGGCGDNLRYGLQMGSAFSDAPMRNSRSGSQAFRLMHLHNNAVGRQVRLFSLYKPTCSSFSLSAWLPYQPTGVHTH